jgi:hypothetical protein
VKRLILTSLLGLYILSPAYGDFLPISGSTVGGFPNAIGVLTSTRKYNGNNGFVTFTPAQFSGLIAQQFTFGVLTLSNTSNGGNGTFSTQLGLTVNFNDLVGHSAVFSDMLRLTAVSGNDGIDRLMLDYAGFPAPQQFTASGATYTVSYDGFFDSLGVQISELAVANKPGGSLAAYLKGTVSAEQTVSTSNLPASTVPEPSSVALLGTVVGGIVFALRRVNS